MEKERKNASLLLNEKPRVMKKLLLILLCLPMIGFGQDNKLDKIIFSNGDTIFVNVVEVGLDKVIYKYQGEKTHHIETNTDIAIIKYSSGRIETFKGLRKLENHIQKEEEKLEKEYDEKLKKKMLLDEKLALQDKNNIIEVNLGSLLFKELCLSYERVVGEKQSIKINIPIYFKRDINTIGSAYNFNNFLIVTQDGETITKNDFNDLAYISGIGISPEYRFYLTNKGAPRGFYLAPQLSFRTFTAKANVKRTDLPDIYQEATDTVSTAFNSLNASGDVALTILSPLFGWKWINGPISIDFNLGAGYYMLDYKYSYEVIYTDSIDFIKDNNKESIWLPRINLSIGVAF